MLGLIDKPKSLRELNARYQFKLDEFKGKQESFIRFGRKNAFLDPKYQFVHAPPASII